MIKIFALLLSITASLAQTPCNSPPQWQGRRYMYIEEKNDYSRGYYTYDAVNKREKISEENNINGVEGAVEYLRLYNQNVEYQYTYSTKKCVKNSITTQWREFGVPAGATYAGQAYYGVGALDGANLLAQVWVVNITDNQGGSGRYTGFWTVEGCAPIEILGTFNNYAVHAQFFDIILGLPDPNGLSPRKECLNL